jgi:hypothetical protein
MKPKDACIEPKDGGRYSTSWAEWFPPHGCNAWSAPLGPDR